VSENGTPKVVVNGDGHVLTYEQLMEQREALRVLLRRLAFRLNSEADLLGNRSSTECRVFRQYADTATAGADMEGIWFDNALWEVKGGTQ